MTCYGYILPIEEAFKYYQKWEPSVSFEEFIGREYTTFASDKTKYYRFYWKIPDHKKLVLLGCTLAISFGGFSLLKDIPPKDLFEEGTIQWADEGFKLLGLDPAKADIYIGNFRKMQVCEKLP